MDVTLDGRQRWYVCLFAWPDDPAAWGAYADWLDDQGEAEAATAARRWQDPAIVQAAETGRLGTAPGQLNRLACSYTLAAAESLWGVRMSPGCWDKGFARRMNDRTQPMYGRLPAYSVREAYHLFRLVVKYRRQYPAGAALVPWCRDLLAAVPHPPAEAERSKPSRESELAHRLCKDQIRRDRKQAAMTGPATPSLFSEGD